MLKVVCKAQLIKRNCSSQLEWTNALPFESIPGPKSLPVIGNFWRFFPVIGDLYNLDTTQLHVELNRRYGDITKLEGLPGIAPLIFISNPEDVAKVFHTEGELPIRNAMQSTRIYREKIHLEPYTRVGHLVDQGYQWKKFRSRVNQLLMKQSNIDVYKGVIANITDDFIIRIREIRSCNNEMPTDFMNELKKWALEVLGVVALDHHFGCLKSTTNEKTADIMKAIEDFHESTYPLDMMSPHLWKYFQRSTLKRMVSSLDYLHRISEEYVDLAEERHSQNRTQSILQKLVCQGGDGRDVAVVLAVDMFLAGVEIIAGMTAAILYALSKYPESQEWLYKKIKGEPHQLTLFTQAFIKETMRLWPVAIGTLRTAGQDIVLSGYKVPKGSELVTCNYIMCRNPEYFDNPLEFYPERWLSADRKEFSQYAFAPFGIGARSCIGRRIAMLELETFLVKILLNFKVKYSYGEVAFESKFLNLISSPLQFTFIDRRRSEKV